MYRNELGFYVNVGSSCEGPPLGAPHASHVKPRKEAVNELLDGIPSVLRREYVKMAAGKSNNNIIWSALLLWPLLGLGQR